MSIPGPALRRAGPLDAAAVREFTRAAYAKWIPVIGREPLPMTADYEFAVRNHWIDLAEEGGAMIALIEMIPKDGHLLVENVAVHSSQQGRGLGAALLRHAEETARSNGFAEVRLYTNAAFGGNLAFYRRLGFTETAREPLPGGGAVVHFSRSVS